MEYITFILGYDSLIKKHLKDMACDEAYDYCGSIANEFVGSKFDDCNKPMYECLIAFLKDKGLLTDYQE